MRNIPHVIEILSGKNRPHDGALASKLLVLLAATGNQDSCQATARSATDLLRVDRPTWEDARKCVYALCVGLPGSAASVIERAQDSTDWWNDFTLGFLEALAYLADGEGSLSARPLKAPVEEAFAEALVARREREGPRIDEADFRAAISSFVENYDGLRLLSLVSGKIDLVRCQGDPRTEAPVQIIRELCTLVFAKMKIEDQLAALAPPRPKKTRRSR